MGKYVLGDGGKTHGRLTCKGRCRIAECMARERGSLGGKSCAVRPPFPATPNTRVVRDLLGVLALAPGLGEGPLKGPEAAEERPHGAVHAE